MQKHPLDSPFAAESAAANAPPIRNILLFCGSRPGRNPQHAIQAQAVGKLLARLGIGLVYGGGSLGLMGETARAALAEGGQVSGVIPQFLMDWEVAEPLCQDMTVVDTMHERKYLMFDKADAILALPGGMGTFDELFEVLSWRNLRLHTKPVWLLGDAGFWNPFLQLLQHSVDEGFSSPEVLSHVTSLSGVEKLAEVLERP